MNSRTTLNILKVRTGKKKWMIREKPQGSVIFSLLKVVLIFLALLLKYKFSWMSWLGWPCLVLCIRSFSFRKGMFFRLPRACHPHLKKANKASVRKGVTSEPVSHYPL